MNQVFAALGLDSLAVAVGVGVAAIGVATLIFLLYRKAELAALVLRRIALVILIAWPLVLFAATLVSAPAYDPGVILVPFRDLASMDGSILVINVLGNLLLFAVPGAALVIYSPGKAWPLWKVVACAFVISALIEVAQYFTARNVSIDDVLLNTVGGAVGYGIGVAMLLALRRRRVEI